MTRQRADNRLGLRAMPDQGVEMVQLIEVEQVTFREAQEAFQEAFRALREGGTLEFSVMDFGEVVEYYLSHYGTDQALTDLLGYRSRRSVWDARSLAAALLKAGFLKVWTGRPEGAPPPLIGVKALKMVPPTL